jgi:hypothetical protein
MVDSPRESSYYGIDRFPVASKYRCPQDVSFKLFLVVLVVVLSVLRITVSGYPIQKFNLFLVMNRSRFMILVLPPFYNIQFYLLPNYILLNYTTDG